MPGLGAGAVVELGYEQVVRDAPVAISVIDAPGRVIYSNARARQLTGRLGREMPADLDGAIDIFHPDGSRYARAEWPAVRSITSGESVVDEEFFYTLPLGARLWIRCSSFPVRGEEGEIVGAVLAMADVSALKSHEARSIELTGVLEHLQDAVLVTDDRFVLTAWNKGAVAMFGWTAEEAIGRAVYELLPQDYSDEQQGAELRELTQTGRWRGEGVWRAKDGSPVAAEGLTVAVPDGDGDDTSGYICIMRDIAERKRAEQALRESQRRTETILERVTDAFYALDRDWRLAYVNEQTVEFAAQLSGRELTRDEVLGQTLWTLLPRTVGTPLEDNYRRAMREQEPVAFEYEYPGSEPCFEVHAYPSEEGLSVYFQEITERKRVEARLAEWAQQQAVLVDLGQRALAGNEAQSSMDDAVAVVAEVLDLKLVAIVEDLPDARQMLVRAGVGWRPGAVGRAAGSSDRSFVRHAARAGSPVVSEALDSDERFTISAFLESHQVTSAAAVPITTRETAYGALVACSCDTRQFRDDEVTFLKSVANVVSTVVERDAAQRHVGEVRETERRRIARDLHDGALQELSAAIATTTDERLRSSLKGVGEQLRGAIYDLRLEEEQARGFANALRELVALQAEMPGGEAIALEVGRGTPDRDLGKVGAEILRIAGEALANARRHSGASAIGISTSGGEDLLRVEVADNGRGFDPGEHPTAAQSAGLRGVRERAALIGGNLQIDSARGRGTTVRIEVSGLGRRRSAEETARILLVDDHASVREAVAAALQREPDLEVSAQAATLAEARELLEGVDLALIDLGLPDGSGIDLIKELQASSPRAQALILSAGFDRPDLARAIQAGAAGVLSKTVHLDEIVDAARRVRAGETLLPLDEVVDLLRFAGERQQQEHEAREKIAQLTPRELEVLQALSEGLDSQAVADRLFITLRTERNHVASILAKLGVHSQLQALVFALRHGVIQLS
ncbi:MAG TPA: PAS domain S-box protein [Thermoleophilaceae bacterium]|nr:PAS domain S-box protein [Thermoleophilaceae bacterium]